MDEVLLNQFKKLQQPKKYQPDPPKPKVNITGVMGDDPMSPYKIPKSIGQFTCLADVMNRKGFAAVFPESYAPVSNYFVAYNIEPYYNPGSDIDYAPGALTIAGMVELTATGQPWALQRAQDIPIVQEIATKYLLELEQVQTTDPKILAYIKRLHVFLKVVDKANRARIRREGGHPVTPDTSIAQIVANLLGLGGK